MNKKTLTGFSMFSGAGIGEMLLSKKRFNIKIANEIVKERSKLYEEIHPHTSMINGDIRSSEVKKLIFESLKNVKVDFIIASPPCQGLSLAGINRNSDNFIEDKRNHLIYEVIFFIKKLQPKFVLIENVPSLLKLILFNKDKKMHIFDILMEELGDKYIIDHEILDSSDYGVPQKRLRAILKIYKKNIIWDSPAKEKKITVRDSIAHLPSLESGQSSNLPFHFARKHTKNHVLWMRNTPSGKSAFDNKKYFPNKNGIRLKGFNSSYRRIKWDEPAPTITIRSDAVSSQRNVHPGRKKNNYFSDARVLTPLELMILNSIPSKNNIKKDTNELLLRKVIGESVPPLLLKKIMSKVEL